MDSIQLGFQEIKPIEEEKGPTPRSFNELNGSFMLDIEKRHFCN